MASGTRGRESCRQMWRTVRLLILRLVTAVAISRYGSVVVVYVAVRTGNARMGAGQRKASVVVVKGSGSPGRRAVAHLTLLREVRRNVVRIVGRLELRQ